MTMDVFHPMFLNEVKALLWRAKNTPGFKMRFSMEELAAARGMELRVYAGYDHTGTQDSFTFSLNKGADSTMPLPAPRLETAY